MDLEKELSGLPEPSIVFIISPPEGIGKVNMEILKIITARGWVGVYITINQPYKNMVKILDRNKIDVNRFFFIDCITETAEDKAEREKNCLFISSPHNLPELGLAFTQAIQAMPEGNRFIFMDALSTLLIYNSAGTTAQFAHFLMTKIKLLGLNGVFMSVEEGLDKQLLSQIEQFCDKCIHYK